MQYILTETEYNDLIKKSTQADASHTKILQELCTQVADHKPVKWGWGGPDPKPWGCIITQELNDNEWYCDKCPVQNVCPLEFKNYSK